VVDDVVYFGAGIWPSEGIFLFALDPLTGNVIWQNDSSGSIEMDQPHGTARAKSGISSQGYLAASGDALLVPTGRAVPAVLRRTDGALLHFPLQAHQHAGGADVVVMDDCLANSGAVYLTAGGERIGAIGLQSIVHPDYVIHAVDDRILGLDRHRLTVQREIVDRKGNKQQVARLTSPVWEIPAPFDAKPALPLPKDLRPPEIRMGSTAWTTPVLEDEASALIAARDKVIVGGRGRVSIVDIRTRARIWSADVDGTTHGLAVADGRLYVSTNRGNIYCYGEVETTPAETVAAAKEPLAAAPDSRYSKAAEEILRLAGSTEGYCVDLGCGDGGLTLELAQRTNLRIYAVDQDPANVRDLREKLDRAGLYGTRVTVHCRDPSDVPYADYCADLVVSGRSLTEVPSDALAAAARRLRRPCGGLLVIGRAGGMNASSRGPLEGAGSWTHQNSGPANTLCSEERRVQGPLEMLWFRDTDFLMANRHGRAPSALVQDGRMFVEGLNGLRAQSLYNGRVLWEFSAPGILASYHREHSIGAAWTGGNICLGRDRVFVHNGNACYVLDSPTGQKLAEWKPPARPDGKPGVWGYLAHHNGILFGSLAREDYLIKCWSDRWDTGQQFTESTSLFALDATTGRVLWSFTPNHSIRHNAIAVGGGRVYLIDRPVAAEDDRDYVEAPSSVEQRRGTSAQEANEIPPTHPCGRLIALDDKTGKRRWESDDAVFGTLLIYSAEHDLLWMGYQAAHQASRPSERANRMAVFDAGDGERTWDFEADYADRPVLNGRTIYAPPGAWDLLTGRKLPPVLGCWIPAIPAGGVLAMPDAASWCTCSYLNQGTIVLRSVADRVQSNDAIE
jgi:outer membrane protein assembly factor BamB